MNNIENDMLALMGTDELKSIHGMSAEEATGDVMDALGDAASSIARRLVRGLMDKMSELKPIGDGYKDTATYENQEEDTLDGVPGTVSYYGEFLYPEEMQYRVSVRGGVKPARLVRQMTTYNWVQDNSVQQGITSVLESNPEEFHDLIRQRLESEAEGTSVEGLTIAAEDIWPVEEDLTATFYGEDDDGESVETDLNYWGDWDASWVISAPEGLKLDYSDTSITLSVPMRATITQVYRREDDWVTFDRRFRR